MTSPIIPRRIVGQIEPLESRIAPATILIGARGLSDNPNDTEYVDHNAAAREGKTSTHADFGALNFVDIQDGSVNLGGPNPLDHIAEGLRGNAADGTDLDPTANRYFFLRLHAGDSVLTFAGGNYSPNNPLISVTAGDVIAVFTDFVNFGSSENEYDSGEFTGLILGPGAKVQVNGGVNGDIVSALDTHKTANLADDTLDFLHLVSSKQNISSLKVLGGAVSGGVFAGGSIDNITISSGSVQNVLAGTAVNGHFFDFVQSDILAPRFTAQVEYGARTAGASITNTSLHDVVERVEAGAGGFGAKGGSLTNISINADTDGFALIGGHGGDVDPTAHVTVGGAGGSLTKINVQGTPDVSLNSVGTVSITVQGVAKTIDGAMLVAGDGGGSVVGTTAVRGGAGGSITGVTAGIVKNIIAKDLSADSFRMYGGVGGDGKTGGLGGSITSASVVISTQDDVGNEIEVVAGDGGAGGEALKTGGTAGAGGALTGIATSNTFFSFDPSVSTHASTLIQSGSGGLTLDPSAAGGAGGAIRTVTLVGFDSDIEAGSGSDGNSGGKGGSITGLTYTASQAVITHNITINAGHGGNALKLAGGAGGTITTVKAPLVDLENLYVNTGTLAGAGGNSLNGRGGAGGGVTSLDVIDADKAVANTNFLNGDVQINGGAGGNGGTGGGAGGALNTIRVEGDHFAVAVQGGQGGNATVKGTGGAGGLVSTAFLRSSGSLNGTDPNGAPLLLNPTGTVAGGTGGDGAGAGGRGGVGGDLKSVSLSNEGDGVLRAGSGGSGQLTVGAVKGGAAGKGGSVTASGMISAFASGSILAGNAGVDGAAAAAGGAILGSAVSAVNGVRAAGDVTIQAGDGSHGGAGGDVMTIGFAGATGTAPTGHVLVKGGNGSGDGAVAGRGGNISGLTGVASSLGDGTITTHITAGEGGGGLLVKASGAGGSVTHSTIATGGGAGAIIVIEAGNAGNSSAAKTGGKGGDVSDIGFAALASGTVIRSVAAGDGGVGLTKGGAGGSISQIFAPKNDIGYRTGQKFGYSTQGGLFAGVGGAGGTSAGTNGSVTGVTATSISSIVAGARNSPIPHLAEKVADISLNGTTADLLLGNNSVFVPDGQFTLVFQGQSTPLLDAHAPATVSYPPTPTDPDGVLSVQDALNALPAIQAVGGVFVDYTLSGGYVVKFNNNGAQPLIEALEIVTRDVVETIPNSVLALPFNTPTNGEVPLPIVATQPGVAPFAGTITLPGSNLFVAHEVTSGNANSNTNEVETIDTSSAGSGPNSEFTLSFLGATTNRIPSGSSASTVQSELNLLSPILFAGGVTVTKSGSVYTVTFDVPGRNPLIAGQAFLEEVERIDLTHIQSSPASEFTLTFNGETTVPIPINASAGTIQTALNNLLTVQSTNINLNGAVFVSPVAPGIFDVTFVENGFQSAITGAATVPEIQTIHVTGALSDTFIVKSGDQATPEFKVGATTAEQLEVALNKLPNIIAASGVTVTKTGQDYLVKFNSVGSQSLLVPDLLQKEKQAVDLTGNAGKTTDYTVHSEYPVYVNEVNPGETKFLDVLDGTPTLQFVPGNLPNTGRFTVVTGGNATTQEIDRINFGTASGPNGSAAALKDGDLFILKYTDTLAVGGSTENSVVIPFTTNITQLAQEVENALNAMPLTKGGIQVVKDPNSAGFPNAIQITWGTKTAQVALGFEAHTPTAHPGGYDLWTSNPATTFITTPVQGNVGTAEVQQINLDTVVARGGVFSLSFAGQTTQYISTSNNLIYNDISAQLNALSAISDFGGVTVTETAPGSHTYTVKFNSPGSVPQITGFAVVPESEVLDISPLTADPTNEFTLSFRGDTTPVFPQGTTAAVIQNELNNLNSVQALSSNGNGPVRVFAVGPGRFRVDFPTYNAFTPGQPPTNGVTPDLAEPDFQNIVIASGPDAFHEIQHLDLRSLTGYADGLFKLNFNGDTTNPLPQDATAQDIENELNNLNSVQQTRHDVGSFFGTGQVAVTQTAHGEFDVKFNVFGQQSSIDGSGTIYTDRFPIQVTQTTDGAPAIVTVSEQVSGAYSGQPVIELVKGTSGTPETQRIDLSSFNGAGLGDFTVSFGASTTAPLTFTGGGAPTAAAVQAAINALPTVPQGGVTVTGGNGVYDVAFVSNGDVASLAVQGRHAEVQQIDLGSLASSADGEFVLDFGGQKTANLAHDATAAQIAAALNSLSNVTDAGGVTVQPGGNSSQFKVTFGKLGNPANIVATGGLTHEIQRIDLGELVGHSDAQFKLTFNGQTTGLLKADLSPAALAAEIQTALNALETVNDTRTSAANAAHTVSAIGQVSVTAGENGNFFVTFDARGDVPVISGYSVATEDRVIPVVTTVGGASTPVPVQSADGSAGTKEVQTIDLTTLNGANTEFQLAFDNDTSSTNTVSAYTTGVLKPGPTAVDTAVTIQNALNALPSVAAAGGVTVTLNGTTKFDVHFTQNGNQPTISASVGQHETQTIDVRALEKFHLTTDTNVPGDNATQEHQLVDLTGVQTDFTLQFGTDRTISLPANATITEIENALNALPSVKALAAGNSGSVSVAPAAATPMANHLVEVTFNQPGNPDEITGTADSANGAFRLAINGHVTQALQVGLIDPNGPTTAQSLIDLTDALNALPEIQALAGHDQGTVSVALDANGNYKIDFNSIGDQPQLTAGGTFSVEPTVDIHRITDGLANGAVPLPTFEATPGRAIGPITTTVTQGSTAGMEAQSFDLSTELANGGTAITITFMGNPTNPITITNPATIASNIQSELQNLPGISSHGANAVTVTDLGSNQFKVDFNFSGDQPSLSVDDSNGGGSTPVTETTKGASSVMELQKLDLSSLPSNSFQVQFGGAVATVTLDGATQADNALKIDAALDNLGTIPNGVTVTSNNDAVPGTSFGTFNVQFNDPGDVAQIGATSFVTTQTTQGGVTNEVQRIDVSALQSSSAAGSTFDLSYNGEVTAPIPRFATATDVQNALNNLPQFAGTPVTVTGSNGVFDVKFGDTIDHAGLILAQAGNEEVQHIDTTSLAAQGSPDFTLTFMSQQTGAITAGSSAGQVAAALNGLSSIQQAGGVTVTETLDAQSNIIGYDVQFNTFANQAQITGAIAVHEQLILDLHNLQNETGFLTFSNGTQTSFPVRTDAGSFSIQQAINSLGGGSANVMQLHPGVFQISYVSAGAKPPLEAFVNKEGNSERVPANSSPAELESAIEGVSVSDVTLTGANGLYNVNFADNLDQLDLGGAINVHEQLRPDIFAGQGTFHVVIGSEQTVELPADATGDQIRLALNNLSAVQDLGGVRSVTINPDSSFLVVFAGDYELPAIQFVAKQNLLANNVERIQAGNGSTREIQTISYTIQGAFDAAVFANARLVGAIADFNEFDSNRFHFYDLVNNPGSHVDSMGIPVDINNVPLPPVVASPANPFKEGDIPIDGIVMAKVIDPKTTNFIPEAALIANPDKTVGGNLFFDYLNTRIIA
jgi:hypothetical protein